MVNEKKLTRKSDSRMLFAHIGRVIAAAMLFWALDDHPYSYFTLLRFVVCGVAAYCAVLANDYNRSSWIWIFGGIAVLFNPIIPIHLDRETWVVIDIAVGLILLISLFFLKPEKVDKLENGRGDN